MNRAEAIRFQKATPARELFDLGVQEIELGALDRIIVEKEAAETWLKRGVRRLGMLALAAPFVFAGVAFTLRYWTGFEWPRMAVETDESLTRAIVFAIFAGILGLMIGGAILGVAISRYDSDSDDDLEFARRLRQDLSDEAGKVESTLAGAARGERFTLYLRTFETERLVTTAADVRQFEARKMIGFDITAENQITRHLSQAFNNELMKLKGGWDLHLAIIDATSRIAPVVFLGNLFLPESKRNDLELRRVQEVTLLKRDWWSIFVELQQKAALTVVLASAASPSVARELLHLAESGKPFVVVCSAADHARLVETEAYSRAITSRFVRHVVLESDDVAPFVAALHDLRRA